MRRLVLLGLDGADWRIIDPLIADGELPNLGRVKENGSHGPLKSTVPPLTPPAWTTIFTGVGPERHGITDFSIPANGRLSLLTTKNCRAPYIWELLPRKVLAFNIPWAFPPRGGPDSEIVCGFGAPAESAFTHPASLKAELMRSVPGYAPMPEGLGPALGGRHADRAALMAAVSKNLDMKIRAARHLLETRQWELAIVAFSATDWMQHFFMGEFNSAAGRGSTAVASVYRKIDSLLGDLLSKGYDVIIVSDHGFAEVKWKLHLNSYLESRGLLARKPPPPSAARPALPVLLSIWRALPGRLRDALRLAIPHIAGGGFPPGALDMGKTKAFLYSADGFICVPEKSDAEAVSRALDGCLDPSGRKAFKTISPAPTGLVAVPQEDILMDCAYGTEVFTETGPSGKDGGHAEHGIFAAHGPNLRPCGALEGLSVADIAPTIMAYFGVSKPASFEGKEAGIVRGGPRAPLPLSSRTRASLRKLRPRPGHKRV